MITTTRYLIVKTIVRIEGEGEQKAKDEICDEVCAGLDYDVSFDDVIEIDGKDFKTKITQTEVVGFLDSPPIGT